jgi:putative transposase
MAARRTGLTLPLPLRFLAAWLAVWLERVLQEQVDYLRAENRLLREKLGTMRLQLTDAERRRLAIMGKRLGRKGLAAVATIASPETILRWYRELVARKYDGSHQRGQGRPKTTAEIVALIVRMAEENERWGYTRIMGALKNLGHEIGRNTIKRILLENGIDPAPERGRRMSWATFIKAHLGAIVGMDFFTAEVVTWLGLIRYHVLFAIDIASRKVEIVGMAVNPGGPWMAQMARNLVDAVDGFLVGKRYVLIDRDPLYTETFRRILGQGGVKVVRLPARSPNLNAFAERFVLSIKSECLDRLVPLGEAHLRRAVLEYTNHYHEERNHQGLDNDLISPAKTTGVDPIWWTVSLRCFLNGLYQLEFDRAVVIERRVAAGRVVEAVDVFAN